jgi:uncharacterized protein YcbK (DUF882 family)
MLEFDKLRNVLTWKKGDNVQLTPHFTTEEFECPCGHCDRQEVSEQLISKLESLRELIDAPIKIMSGFRCGFYQDQLRQRGYETAKGISQHQLGRAADITSKKLTELFSLAPQFFKAIGKGRTFIHVDLRSDKERRWGYK